MKAAATFALCMGLALLAGLPPAPLAAGEAGDAVFAERGPWTEDRDGLAWSVDVAGPDAPGFLRVHDGRLVLHRVTDPSDGQPVLELTRKTDSRSRQIGPFPASGGDPVLIFFLEQTARDMAQLTGGSPFYIRNRIKDAVFRGGEIRREGNHATAVFRPFADDPNAARMQGFETLELRFVMTDPAKPIREMQARTTGAAPGYDHRMVLQ